MIDIEIEKLIKIDCLNRECPYNLESRGYLSCNMKRIMISEKGECLGFIKIKRINRNRSFSEDMKESLEKYVKIENKQINMGILKTLNKEIITFVLREMLNVSDQELFDIVEYVWNSDDHLEAMQQANESLKLTGKASAA